MTENSQSPSARSRPSDLAIPALAELPDRALEDLSFAIGRLVVPPYAPLDFDRWVSDLRLFFPHGYEGQEPELVSTAVLYMLVYSFEPTQSDEPERDRRLNAWVERNKRLYRPGIVTALQVRVSDGLDWDFVVVETIEKADAKRNRLFLRMVVEREDRASMVLQMRPDSALRLLERVVSDVAELPSDRLFKEMSAEEIQAVREAMARLLTRTAPAQEAKPEDPQKPS